MYDKIIVTNVSALTHKYGNRAKEVVDSLEQLIVVDNTKGLSSLVVSIDDADQMSQFDSQPVSNPKDTKENKDAIDAVFRKFNPDYLMIVGSSDVIPHQDMNNPIFHPGKDRDRFAEGDLPYACESSYSPNAEDFVGPTRVVGRLPDLTGADTPDYILQLIRTACGATPKPISDYQGYFGLSAAQWKGSTRMSLDRIFGANVGLLLAPEAGPKWTKEQLRPRLHFINCHGAPADHQFYGQQGESYPVAHDSTLLSGRIVEGSVVAAECCYGAQLYDAGLLGDNHVGICSAYLGEKAYGFFGSTTIAYGPADENGSADLICQFFLKSVLAGASLGRAALEARQKFAAAGANLDPVDLKTLAQFNLLGDPSIVPIEHLTVGKTLAKGILPTGPGGLTAGEIVERKERREQLRSKGQWLSQSQSVISSKDRFDMSPHIQTTIEKIAHKFKLSDAETMSFRVQPAPEVLLNKSLAKSNVVSDSAFHVVIAGRESQDVDSHNGKKPASLESKVCIVAKEVGGEIVSFRELYQK